MIQHRARLLDIDGVEYTLPEAICNVCGHTWVLKDRVPIMCGKCRSVQWNRDPKKPLTYNQVMGKVYARLCHLDNRLDAAEGRSVLERDNYTCQACGMKENDIPRGMKSNIEVHHIDGDHNNDDGMNQIALCRVCHGIITGAMAARRNNLRNEEMRLQRNHEREERCNVK